MVDPSQCLVTNRRPWHRSGGIGLKCRYASLQLRCPIIVKRRDCLRRNHIPQCVDQSQLVLGRKLSYGTFSIQQIEVDQYVLDRLFQNRASAVTTCVPNWMASAK